MTLSMSAWYGLAVLSQLSLYLSFVQPTSYSDLRKPPAAAMFRHQLLYSINS